MAELVRPPWTQPSSGLRDQREGLVRVSVVIPAHNEGANLADTVDCILTNSRYPDFEIVVVDDGSTDGCGDRVAARFGGNGQVALVRGQSLGISGARNLGAAQASGRVLVFLDGHCFVPPGWLERLVAPLADPLVGMVGPAFTSLNQGGGPVGLGMTWLDAALDPKWLAVQADEPYVVPLLPGGCQVVRRAEFLELGGYDAGMTRWGSEDQELSLRYWLMGYQVVGQPAVIVYHLFRQSSPHGVNWAEVVYNRLRLALLHFTPERAARVLDTVGRGQQGFGQVIMWLLESDAMARRQELLSMRRRDDDEFFSTFGMPV